MRSDLQKMRGKIEKLITIINGHCTGAYAAQSAYFFVLSLIPIILLLLTLVQYTPLTKDMIIEAVVEAFPASINTMLVSIVNQVYNRSGSIIPITIIVALWSAGKGVLAITSGLNKVYESEETRNYFVLRLRASFYTVVFLVAIVISLLLSVFGNTLSLFIVSHFPIMKKVLAFILSIRTLGSFIMLTLFWILIYRFLPNRKDKLRNQVPGAVFAASGWLLLSFVFSIYLNIFTGFSNMYGSMTTIILLLLWLYGCMYIVLLGGEVNVIFPRALRYLSHTVLKKEEKDTENEIAEMEYQDPAVRLTSEERS